MRLDIFICLPHSGEEEIITQLKQPHSQTIATLDERIVSDHVIVTKPLNAKRDRARIQECCPNAEVHAHLIEPPQCALDWKGVEVCHIDPVREAMEIHRYSFRRTHELQN